MINSLRNNFSSKITAHYPNNYCIIKELNSSAKLSESTIIYPGDLYAIDPTTYKNWKGILQSWGICRGKGSNQTEWFEDSDCDGVVFLEHNGFFYITLVELKSTFDSTDLLKAYKQIYYTLLKIHLLLSICDGYSPLKVKAKGVIACLPPKDEKTTLSSLMQERQKSSMLPNRCRPDIEFALDLYNSTARKIQTTIGTAPIISNVIPNSALPADLKSMQLDILLQLANNIHSNSKQIDLGPLL